MTRRKILQAKHISDRQVCQAYADARERRDRDGPDAAGVWPYELLERETGAPQKVALAAMERAQDHGLVECGVSLRSGWLTDAGLRLLSEAAVADRDTKPHKVIERRVRS